MREAYYARPDKQVYAEGQREKKRPKSLVFTATTGRADAILDVVVDDEIEFVFGKP